MEPCSDDNANMEYTKQLLLSCLLNICHKLAPGGGAVAAGGCRRRRMMMKVCVCVCCFTVLSSLCADVLDEDKFSVELVVQCIRTSDMPQTHHHALLLLGTAAAIFPVRAAPPLPSVHHHLCSSSSSSSSVCLQLRVLCH